MVTSGRLIRLAPVQMAEDAAECEGALAELGVESVEVRQAMVGELLAMPPPC